MDIMGARVRHNKYGLGDIIDQADSIITVRFPPEGGTKKFLYPSIFENQLTLCSDELQARQLEEISQQRAALEADLAEKLAASKERARSETAAQKARKKVRNVRPKPAKSSGRRKSLKWSAASTIPSNSRSTAWSCP
jgi:hypothetical protein